MTDHFHQSIRRNAVKREDQPFIAGIAVAAAVGAAFAGCHPTGQHGVDVFLCVALAATTVWFSASASWWALAIVGWLAALGAGTVPGILVALAASAIALYLGSVRRSLVWARCLSAGVAIQVLLRMHANPFFGASALVAAIAIIVLWGVSAQRRRHVVRYRIARGLLVAGGVVLAAGLLFAGRVAVARADVTHGYQGVLDGLNQLQGGDVKKAAATLHTAAAHLRHAADAADSVWTQPARLVPVVAQHRDALASVMTEAAAAADSAAKALDVIDLDALGVEGGTIDVQYVAALAQPLADLQHAVDRLHAALDEASSPWLVSPVAHRLDRYRHKAEQAAQQAEATAAAARTGPAMLGKDGPRHYLIAFASPAEARGTIGVMGNYAVITIDKGHISRSGFGRVSELGNEVTAKGGVPLRLSAEFVQRYGANGLDNKGRATLAMWSNVLMTPDLPTAASIMTQLWEGTGHEQLDGVFVIDPAGLAALLKSTGPITVEGLDHPLDASNLERFLLIDQYQSATTARADLLEKVATATLDAILKGNLPAPQVLAKNLGPAATGGHLSGWAARPDEEQLLHDIGMDGAMPTPAGGDGFAVVDNNATANKIDSFLDRTVRYTATVHGHVVDSTITITMHNSAPSSGYPDYVIGSAFLDLPKGTNRTLLTVYSPLNATGATLDGKNLGTNNATELGWHAYTVRLDLAPGQTRIVTITFHGTLAADHYSLLVRPQATANPDEVSLDVRGDARIVFAGRVERRTVIDERGARALR